MKVGDKVKLLLHESGGITRINCNTVYEIETFIKEKIKLVGVDESFYKRRFKVINMLKGRVLLLNMDFEVLGTVAVARAIRMTMREENPILVHEYVPDGFLTSGNGVKYPVPSVISLKHYVNIRQKRADSGAKRMKIYLRDGHQCQYCGTKAGKVHPLTKKKMEAKDLTLDHVTPKSKGGSGHPNNLVTACKLCNQRKADRTPNEARMPLITKIHDITQVGVDNIMLCKYVEHRPEWFYYLQGKEGFAEAYEKYLEMAA